MDAETSAWGQASKEETTGLDGSQGSTPSHSYDEDIIKPFAGYDSMSEEAKMAWRQSEDKLKKLSEKLSQALLDNTTKDNLVRQHVKIAEEAVAGWEKCETEATDLRKKNDKLSQEKLALDDKVSHLDGALKECMRQLRNVREEQEKKISEAVSKKISEWETQKFELDSRIIELEELLKSKSKELIVSDVSQNDMKVVPHEIEIKSKPVNEREFISERLELLQSENTALKQEISSLSKQMGILTDEKEQCKKSSLTISKQHADMVKKTSRVEAECQKLRGLLRKRSGSFSMVSMKQDKEAAGYEAELKHKKSHGKVSISSADLSSENHLGNMLREIEHLRECLLTVEGENKALKDTLIKRDNELKASRVSCARTAAKLSTVEEQLESLKGKSPKPNIDVHVDITRSESVSNTTSLTSISGDDHDNDNVCAESWASALIAELDQFKKDKVSGKIERISDIPNVDLMDDFLEMEKLASIPSASTDQTKKDKLNSSPEVHCTGALNNPISEKATAAFEESLLQKEQQLKMANQNCSDLSKKLASVNEVLDKLKSKDSWNETILIMLQEKIDAIVGAAADGEELQRVLEDMRSTMTFLDESQFKPYVCINPSTRISSKALNAKSTDRIIIIELAMAISSVVNYLQYVAQQSREKKLTGTQNDELNLQIAEVAEIVELTVCGRADITDLVSKLALFLSRFESFISDNVHSEVDHQIVGVQSKNSSLDDCTFCLNDINPMFRKHMVNFHIIRKINTIKTEKVALESELKFYIDSCFKLEEELLSSNTQNTVLQRVLSTTNEKLEHLQNQLNESHKTIASLENSLASIEEEKESTNQKLESMSLLKSDVESQLRTAEREIKNLHGELNATKIDLQNKLSESQKQMVSLEECLASTCEEMNLTNQKLEAMSLHKSDIESQLMAAEIEIKNLQGELSAAKLELQNEQMHSQNAMSKYSLLEGQLQRKKQNSGYSKQLALEEEIRKRQEEDIATAASKLAECQETILSLSRQLKALACPVDDPLEYPHFEEKQIAKDQDCELEPPWVLGRKNASWEFERDYFRMNNKSKIAVSDTNHSSEDDCGIYKVSLPESPTFDFMDGQFTIPNSSDTEESSPARSPMGCTHEKNGASIFSK